MNSTEAGFEGLKIELSIIIVSWNVRQFLKGCIDSIRREIKGINYEVIVVDNASDDDTVEMIKQEYPWVRLIDNDKNQGFARANNQAILISLGRYLLLLNPDTLVLPHSIGIMLNFSRLNPKVGMVGPKIISKLGEATRFGARRFPGVISDLLIQTFALQALPIFGGFIVRLLYHPYPSYKTQSVQAISGSCMLVNRNAFTDVGLLNENTFHYGEDVEWCFRFHEEGWKIVYVAEAKIVHFGGESSKQNSNRIIVDGRLSQYAYYLRCKNLLSAELFKLFTKYLEVPRILILASIKYALSHITTEEYQGRISSSLKLFRWQNWDE